MSKTIYIVDDEPGVLRLLGLVLRRLDPSWRVTEFSTPSQALAAVRRTPPHLVLSDHEMPEMTGSAMLEIIRQIAPETVRVIISSHVGHTDNLGAAHQHLSKPCAIRDLETRIRQALAAQEALQYPQLARLVCSLISFPVLPTAYADLLYELENEDSALERTPELLRQDGGILTRVLQATNSPLFRGFSTVTDPKAALLQLGTRKVKALVLSMHVFDSYQRVHFPEMPVELLWRHSCSTARLARELCREALGDGPANDAFFAGMVHDLGCLVLMENHPESFRAVCQQAQQEGKPLCQAEKEVFQAAHEELSAFMLRLWGIPETVIEAVTYHNAPWESPRADRFSPTTALYMANIVTRQQSPPDRLMTPELDRKYLDALEAPNPCPSTLYAEKTS
jgi:HD-like signal output (HDOD) protein/CheY-like chemotaxis protein